MLRVWLAITAGTKMTIVGQQGHSLAGCDSRQEACICRRQTGAGLSGQDNKQDLAAFFGWSMHCLRQVCDTARLTGDDGGGGGGEAAVTGKVSGETSGETSEETSGDGDALLRPAPAHRVSVSGQLLL